ncbi:aldehyde dehydrogenase family protein [Nocardia sp. CDC159]|uniref:Aldehyde dehydrogenase family protein n=1 Tax=Nocardia pulmonis TaxID=2951408 RepID=A0A9X2E3S5_9NOCA|nr:MULTISPECIES: aldehyde dehydrogenase family protein [Nocardia]MCM6772290.1 aldehyde dehydrogenase family protein [Nocardia pulmonis]MCM6785052.1 aldehyde dehydrogenase family protein [Nocardia sp. CDC159]
MTEIDDATRTDADPMPTAAELGAIVGRARKAQGQWASEPATARAAALRAGADALREHVDELAATLESETGRPAASGREGVLAGVGTLDQYAELGPVHRGRTLHGQWDATDFMIPQPRGVVVALTPWNDPVAIAAGLLGAALVTGNTVVHKPSERCPRTGVLLGRLLAAHFPDGVLQTVSGDGRVGAALAEAPEVDVIAHVGGTATGRAVAAAAARTGAKVLLENGGNDALLVDEGVDPAWAAEQAALGAFANAGQICTSVERIYVHRSVAEAFVRALCERAERWNLDPQPLVDERLRAEVDAQVREAVAAGAKALVGGRVPDASGTVYPATVLTDCAPDMRVLREETFGPVAPVRVVADFETGLREACADEYGLAATVLTASVEHAQRAWRALPVGTVKINAVFGGAPGGAAQPRGRSGSGFGYGPELLDEMTTMKVVHMRPPGR